MDDPAAPVPPARPGGAPSHHGYARTVHAIFHIGSTGCRWRAPCPGTLPPMTSVQGHVCAWRTPGLPDAMTDLPVRTARVPAGRAREPTAGAEPSGKLVAADRSGAGFPPRLCPDRSGARQARSIVIHGGREMRRRTTCSCRRETRPTGGRHGIPLTPSDVRPW